VSHHLDTPLAAQTGQLYLDDLYVFPGEGSTSLIMDVNSNVNGKHSHFDRADFETLTYRVSFAEPDLSGWQPDHAQNSFAGSLVYSIVLEIPHQDAQPRPGARTSV
jgi:hypothetical protein